MEKNVEFYPIVDMHSTWLVLNPIQGCPKKCKYCFLAEKKLNAVIPYVLATPDEAVDQLLKSKLFIKDIPLCLFSQTDCFSTPKNIEYAKKLVSKLIEKNIKNPIIFVTKCKIPFDFIEFIDFYEKKGHKFIFFLSYSGLDNDMEIGVNKEVIKNNFINLSKYNKNIIHYWRPLIPENSSKEIIDEVFNFVKKYTKASVSIGLKITDNIIDNIGWEQLNKNRDEAKQVNNVWNKNAYDYIWNNIVKREKNYPIFQTTACALSYVLGVSDRKAYFNSNVCLNNNCPSKQRNRCRINSLKQFIFNEDEIVYQLRRFKYNITPEQVHIDQEKRQIHITGVKLQLNIIAFLTDKYKMHILVGRDNNDYYWNSEITNTKILKI